MSTLFAGLDTETTGLKWDQGDRIIEINMQVFRLEDRKRLINWTQRISNQGKAIDKKAFKVHGIAEADLVGKPTFKEVAPKIVQILDRVQGVVTHNGEWFDLPFLAYELDQAGLALPAHLVSFDTMREGMFASYDTKPPTLKELCWSMFVDYDETRAHAASYDVDVMMQSFFNAVDRGFYDISSLTRKDAA